MTVGEIIRHYRLRKELTLEEVANACGVSKVAVLKWENGATQNIKRDKIAKLAMVLNISPITLVTGELETDDDSISTNEFLNQLGVLLQRVRELDQSEKQQIMTFVSMTIEYKQMKKDASTRETPTLKA
ncbi:MAG: helix-turn-helix transcriptional regulator [Clostridia bacterium]|nr:helix-turn-helix transcriptional regulator [Clostridia bacterium]